MRRLVYAARYVRGELAALFAIALFAVVDVWPSLAPDQRRQTARQDFGETHNAIASWLDRHFELIESAVPSLHFVGRRVEDSCRTNWRREPFSLERKPAQVVCTRTVCAAYGCDGDLQNELTGLSFALDAIGWGFIDASRAVRGRLGPSPWPMRPLSWSPRGGSAGRLPSLAGQSDDLRESTSMYLRWADRADAGDIIAPRSPGSADPARASLLYQPVEVGGDDVTVLVAHALGRFENTLIIELQADYYENENVNAEPDRLPKRFRLARGYLP